MRPGASRFSDARPFAATGAMRLVGTRTPGPIVMRLVLRGGERHGDEDVGAEELRVVEPRVREAERLGALHGLPGVDAGGEGDAEVHARYLEEE